MAETTHPFAQRVRQAPDSQLLNADQHTGAPLMCMPEVEKQAENHLILEHGESADRGMLTGALGGIIGPLSLYIGKPHVAKRHAHLQWPAPIRESLRPDGSTTRLIDLERERGLGAQAATRAGTKA